MSTKYWFRHFKMYSTSRTLKDAYYMYILVIYHRMTELFYISPSSFSSIPFRTSSLTSPVDSSKIMVMRLYMQKCAILLHDMSASPCNPCTHCIYIKISARIPRPCFFLMDPIFIVFVLHPTPAAERSSLLLQPPLIRPPPLPLAKHFIFVHISGASIRLFEEFDTACCIQGRRFLPLPSSFRPLPSTSLSRHLHLCLHQ